MSSMWRAGWAITVAGLLLVGGCGRAAASPVRLPLGVDVGWVVNGPPASVALTAAKASEIKATGAGLARVEFRTSPFFGQVNPAFYQDYDQVVQNLAQAGIQVLGLIDYATVSGAQSAWTQNGASNAVSSGANAYTAQFAQTAAAIMAHYKGKIRYWEIWNEPNAWTQNDGGGVYSGGTFMYPNNYAALLQQTYDQAVGVDHLPVTIISAGLLGGAFGGAYTAQNSGATYLAQVFQSWHAQGLQSFPLDAVGQHLYIAQGGNAGDVVSAAQVAEYLNWVHQVPLEFGSKGLPTFLTEVGWNSSQVGATDKQQNLETAIGVAEKTAYVHALVWYNLQSSGTARYGLYQAGGTPSPSLAAYRKLAAAWGP